MTHSGKELPQDDLSQKKLTRRTLLSFAAFSALSFSGWKFFSWIKNSQPEGSVQKPLRQVLETNEKLFSPSVGNVRLVKEYPVLAAVKKPRVNGSDGLENPLPDNWRLNVLKQNGTALSLSLEDIKKLPKKEVVFNFKCIEGWSQVTHWGGVPLKTFMTAYGLVDESKMAYVGLQTPDKKYYVGIDMPSAVQEQTLLCYEVNGAALPLEQGYPLRLIIPVKYGIKHLKRIGTMYFSNGKPPDFWAERGYDYYSGH